MKIIVFLLAAVLSSASASNPVPHNCLNCICQVESNCNTKTGCRWDVNSYSCGPYQIKQAYYTGATSINPNLGSDWRSCAKDMTCSENTVQAYMTRYATSRRLGHSPTCEDFARIHNGGPNGFHKSSTDEYWAKVSACLN